LLERLARLRVKTGQGKPISPRNLAPLFVLAEKWFGNELTIGSAYPLPNVTGSFDLNTNSIKMGFLRCRWFTSAITKPIKVVRIETEQKFPFGICCHRRR
jgi:hypothetical protein